MRDDAELFALMSILNIAAMSRAWWFIKRMIATRTAIFVRVPKTEPVSDGSLTVCRVDQA
jgi:hypothetical protein